MAYLIGNGFDTNLFGQDWSAGWSYDAVGRFGYGGSILIRSSFPSEQVRSISLGNEQVWFVTFAWGNRLFGGSGAMFINLYDGATVQLQIRLYSDGNAIEFWRAGTTMIGNWTGASAAASFDHFQLKVKIDNSAGYVIGRKNGSATDNYSLTSVDTQNTANAYANQVGIGSVNSGNWCYVDDFLCFSDNGAAPNDWVGDVRAWQCQPTLDTAQKDFSAITPLITNLVNIGYTGTGSNQTVTAGRVSAHKTWSNNQGGTFTQAVVRFSGSSGSIKSKLALYYGDGNVRGWDSSQSNTPGAKPGHLIAVSNELTGYNGDTTFTFPGTVSLLNGHSYCFALLTDTNVTVAGSNTAGGDPIFTYNNPGGYADGFPTDMGPIYTEAQTFTMAMYIPLLTTSNAGMVSDRTPDDLTTYVYSNVVGDYDLYDLFDIPYNPTAIIGMVMRIRTAKTDSGARGAKIAALSGATAFETAEFSPLTAFTDFNSIFYGTDPDTGLAWTQSGINALQMGPKVSS
jgi:hypothetical protein